jgi:hypothetical protein
MNGLTLNMVFGGAVLPVAKNEAGQDVVPLKPICDVIGLKWETQRLKLGLKSDTCTPDNRGACPTTTPPRGGAGAEGEATPPRGGGSSEKDGYFARMLGICTQTILWAGQSREMVCIRLDRVSAYMFTINPNQVRVNGNEAAADFLEKKHQEWADLIHAYESERGDMLRRGATAKVINIRTLLSVCREKRVTTHEPDRRVLEAISKDLSAELGLPYQSDLLDSAGG